MGIGRSALRHARFQAPFYGARRLVTSELDPEYTNEALIRRAHDFSPLLRQGEVFSHQTALVLCGVPLRLERIPARSPEVDVMIAPPAVRSRRRGARGHTGDLPKDVWHTDTGLPFVSPLDALCQSAGDLSFLELVVAIDYLILPRWIAGRKTPIVSKERIIEMLETRTGRGVRKLRAAAEVSRVGAESRMESELHFEMARLGLDELLLQHEIFDVNGRFVGRFDMVDPVLRKIIEYDGEQHRLSRAQYTKDLQRLEAARQEGYEILRLVIEDFHPSRLAATRARICEFLGRDPRPLPARLSRYFGEA